MPRPSHQYARAANRHGVFFLLILRRQAVKERQLTPLGNSQFVPLLTDPWAAAMRMHFSQSRSLRS